jgi:hypothetical protein
MESDRLFHSRMVSIIIIIIITLIISCVRP